MIGPVIALVKYNLFIVQEISFASIPIFFLVFFFSLNYKHITSHSKAYFYIFGQLVKP